MIHCSGEKRYPYAFRIIFQLDEFLFGKLQKLLMISVSFPPRIGPIINFVQHGTGKLFFQTSFLKLHTIRTARLKTKHSYIEFKISHISVHFGPIT